MNQKDAYEKKIRAQLDEWSAEIDQLKAKAEKAEADTRLKLNEDIDAATAKKEAVREKLDELRDAGDDAWEDLKVGLQGAWRSMETAVQSAQSRFSQA